MYFLPGSSVIIVNFEHLGGECKCYMRIFTVAFPSIPKRTANQFQKFLRKRLLWKLALVNKQILTRKYIAKDLLSSRFSWNKRFANLLQQLYFHHWEICNNTWLLRAIKYTGVGYPGYISNLRTAAYETLFWSKVQSTSLRDFSL